MARIRKNRVKAFDDVLATWGDLELAQEKLSKLAAGNAEESADIAVHSAVVCAADFIGAVVYYALVSRE